MDFTEIIAIVAIVLVVGGALTYIIKEKKKGHKCIGCPYADHCASRSKCSCNHTEQK